ncbi:exonuclease, putative [Eimeria praecox]|uniref:Exonuclease, putative n=1 Tax=Eimeria praecox TaxID=51316 RepID=U6H5D4_9EIME|nr:exonuclease, putative [Eimeria praecox]
MVDKVIAACRELGIRCIVAPFEADAQLAYLSRTNQIHSAISEDSDLLAYGCKRVMLKMDKEGKCEVLRLPFLQDENDNYLAEMQTRLNKTAKQEELLRTLKGLNHERFVAMCVLGGCDYTNKVHINGMGVGTACRLITQLRSLQRVLDFLCRDKKWASRFPVVSHYHRSSSSTSSSMNSLILGLIERS